MKSGWLLVADTVVEVLYVFRIPDMVLTGQLHNVRVGAHMGTIALSDGRIVLVDDRNIQVLVLRINVAGQPAIVGQANIPASVPWNRAAWGIVDPGMRYFAVSSDSDAGGTQTVTFVDLNDYSVAQIQLTLNKNSAGAYEEVHVYLAGNPLNLFVTAGEEVRAYGVKDLFQSGGASHITNAGAPASTLKIPTNSHGPAITHGTQRLYSATADGLAVVDITAAQLSGPRIVKWAGNGITTSQNVRPRPSFDSGFVYGAVIANPAPDANGWADSRNFIHAVDLRTETGRMIPLALGVIGRFSLSTPYALFWNIHPFGDNAYLLDIDPSSSTFQQIVAVVPLAKLSNGPVTGQPVAGAEARTGTITADGRWAFVSHGGDGIISVINTATRRVSRTVNVPTPLSAGGYIVAVQPGTPLIDMHAR
jgi:YVTN family beta-propeller protein